MFTTHDFYQGNDMSKGQLRKYICAILVILLFCTVYELAVAQEAYHHKKLIEYGWDVRRATSVKKYIRQMEIQGPFDGIIFRISDDLRVRRAFDIGPWTENMMKFDVLESIEWDACL